MFLCLLFLFNSSPLVLGLLFLFILITSSFFSLLVTPWLSFILLLVYVGGLIVLFVYCLAALKITHSFKFYFIFLLPIFWLFFGFDLFGFRFDLFLFFSLLNAIGILLFAVILIVVNLVDPNAGALKAL